MRPRQWVPEFTVVAAPPVWCAGVNELRDHAPISASACSSHQAFACLNVDQGDDMAFDINRTLRQALSRLEGEKTRIERQITGVRQALGAVGPNSDRIPRAPVAKRRRRRMSAAERKAVGARMKAYWAKRKRTSKRKTRAAAK
jgi:hypothetical protein